MVDTRKVKVDFSLEDMDLSEFKGALKVRGTFVWHGSKRSGDKQLKSR